MKVLQRYVVKMFGLLVLSQPTSVTIQGRDYYVARADRAGQCCSGLDRVRRPVGVLVWE